MIKTHYCDFFHNLFITDAAEVVLSQCIDFVPNDKEVNTIKISFEFLDDIQDPVKGGNSGLVNRLCSHCCKMYSVNNTDDETEQTGHPTHFEQREPARLKKLNSNNHVLQWMVKA